MPEELGESIEASELLITSEFPDREKLIEILPGFAQEDGTPCRLKISFEE